MDVYGPLTLREEHRLRIFKNRVLTKLFGSKLEEVAGSCRRLHNEELITCTLHEILLG
jgi:hypothetical protein